MRDIKFRAWHKDIKKMYKIGQITLEKGIWNYEPEDRAFIGMSKPYQPSFILMQYTGLKDKNGKEIYEGDIVKIPPDYDTYGLNAGEMYEIYFKYGGFRLKPKYRFKAKGYWLEDAEELEVIGNIYENPELLKD